MRCDASQLYRSVSDGQDISVLSYHGDMPHKRRTENLEAFSTVCSLACPTSPPGSEHHAVPSAPSPTVPSLSCCCPAAAGKRRCGFGVRLHRPCCPWARLWWAARPVHQSARPHPVRCAHLKPQPPALRAFAHAYACAYECVSALCAARMHACVCASVRAWDRQPHLRDGWQYAEPLWSTAPV